MADTKKRGFHALEERIHAMHEEDEKREKKMGSEEEHAPRTAQQGQESEQPRKK